MNFTGISLESKWKERSSFGDGTTGNKSGGYFMKTVIDYKGQNQR